MDLGYTPFDQSHMTVREFHTEEGSYFATQDLVTQQIGDVFQVPPISPENYPTFGSHDSNIPNLLFDILQLITYVVACFSIKNRHWWKMGWWHQSHGRKNEHSNISLIWIETWMEGNHTWKCSSSELSGYISGAPYIPTSWGLMSPW